MSLIDQEWLVDTTPIEFANKYVDQSSSTFTDAAENVVIDHQGMPKVRLRKGDRVIPGGGGIVIQCEPENVKDLKFALKVTRPSLLEDDATASGEFDLTVGEYIKHAPLSHLNIARVFFGGFVEVFTDRHRKLRCPAMLMEWLDDPQHFCTHLVKKKPGYLRVAELIAQSFDALQRLHDARLVHWDMKSANLLVDKSGTPKLTDLGNSRPFGDANLQVQTSDWNLPPKLEEQIKPKPRKHDSKRVSLTVPSSSWHSGWIDMWMFAKELNRFLKADASVLIGDRGRHRVISQEIESFNSDCFPVDDENAQFARSFFHLILQRILHPKEPDEPRYYRDARDVANDFRKLAPEFGAAQGIAELEAIPQHVVRLPQSRNAPFTARVKRVVSSALIRRLSKHSQLATLAHVYPGATHRRSEHSIGVMATVAQYVRALFADRSDPFWRVMIAKRDVDALLLSGLLHDVGHVAFGHFLEEMKGLFEGRMHEDYVTELLDPLRQSGFGEVVRGQIAIDRLVLTELVRQD